MRSTSEYVGLDPFVWFFGVVEDRNDPLKIGRIRVRCFGWHTEDKTELPTQSLPWAQPIQDITSGAISGFGQSPSGILEGTWVIGFFLDGKHAQRPVVIGTLAGIPSSPPDSSVGFNDPFGSYPVSNLLNEPDVNRLARNDEYYSHPLVESKSTARITSVPMAFSDKVWDEPGYAYNAQYPYNHVQQTESGHIKEIDDTSRGERIHEYHKAGTFYEVDAVGNKTTRIQGSNYKLVVGHDYLYVDGNLNLTVGGKLNIKCKEYNVEVSENANYKIGQNENKTVGGNVTDTITGSESLTTGGSLTQQISGSHEVAVGGETKKKFGGTYSVRYESDYKYWYGADTYHNHNGGTDHTTDVVRTGVVDNPSIPAASGPGAISSVVIADPHGAIGNPIYITVGGTRTAPTAVVSVMGQDGKRYYQSTGKGLGPSKDGGPNAGTLVPGTLSANGLDQNVTAPATLDGDCNRDDLGDLSEAYESGGDPAAIGQSKTDGYAYGSYQIATGPGTFPRYVKFLANRAEYSRFADQINAAGGTKAASSGSVSFGDTWRSMCEDPAFVKSQKDFIKATHYDVAVDLIKKSTGIDICSRGSRGLQDTIWSTSVQHGPGGAVNVFERALENTGKTAEEVSNAELISAIYDERGANGCKKYFSKSNDAMRTNIINRYKTEKVEALAMG